MRDKNEGECVPFQKILILKGFKYPRFYNNNYYLKWHFMYLQTKYFCKCQGCYWCTTHIEKYLSFHFHFSFVTKSSYSSFHTISSVLNLCIEYLITWASVTIIGGLYKPLKRRKSDACDWDWVQVSRRVFTLRHHRVNHHIECQQCCPDNNDLIANFYQLCLCILQVLFLFIYFFIKPDSFFFEPSKGKQVILLYKLTYPIKLTTTDLLYSNICSA